MNVETRVREAIAASGVAHDLVPCDPEFADTAAFCAHYEYSMARSANTILVSSKRPQGRHAACVVLATTRLDVNRKVCELLDVKKASFARPETTSEITGMEIGGVTPLGLPKGLPLFVDARVMDLDRVIIGGGSRSLKLDVDPELFHHLGATVVSDLASG